MYIIKRALLVTCATAGLSFGAGSAVATESGFELTLGRAIELHEAGGFDAAIQMYRSLREDRPQDPGLNYELARSLKATGDLAGCKSSARTSLASPSSWQAAAFMLLARCQRESGETSEAAGTYAYAAELHPDQPFLQLDYAMSLQESGAIEAAQDRLDRVMALARLQPEVLLAYGSLLDAQGDQAGGLLLKLRFIMLAPQSPQAVGVAEQILALSQAEPLQEHAESHAPFASAFRLAQRAARESGSESQADRLSHFLQQFILGAVADAQGSGIDSPLRASTVEPLLSLAEHDVLDTYLYFIGALARTEGSPEWLSVHRRKFERLVEYLALSDQTS